MCCCEQVFDAFEECKVSVDVIASSEVSLSMTLDSKQQTKDIPLLMVSECAVVVNVFSCLVFFPVYPTNS